MQRPTGCFGPISVNDPSQDPRKPLISLAWGRAMMSGMDSIGTAFPFRHTLATLAYRTRRAVENSPPDFAKFELGAHPKTPEQILAHMGDLMDWALSLVEGNQKWQNSAPLPWNDEVARFFRALESLDQAIAATELPSETANRLFQGPIADALTHTGQLAMLRRLAGCPIRGENYFIADIAIGRVGIDQPPQHKPF
jgi:hypothetical protein